MNTNLRFGGRVRARALVGTALSLALSAVPMTPASAVPGTDWTGSTGSWFTGSNWTAGVPDATFVATITNGSTAQIAGAAAATKSLTISGGSKVDLQAGGSLSSAFGNATTAGDGTGTASNGTILLSGSSNITNTIQLNAGTLASNISAVLSNQISLFTNNNLISAASGTTLNLNFSSITTGGTAIGGAGTVIFSGDAFYTGTTTINSGATLQLGNGSTTGSIASSASIADSGTLAISHSGAFNLSDNITGTGGLSLVAANTATVTLSGTNSYSGTTDIQGGKLLVQFSTSHLPSSSTVNVGVSGTLDLQQVSQTIGNLTGSGTVLIDQTDVFATTLTLTNANFTGTITQNPVAGTVLAQNLIVGAGTVILAGTNSWTGTTTINSGGTLQLGNGSTGGNIPTGAITDNGNLTINHSDNLTYAAVLGGSGSLTKAGTGDLTGSFCTKRFDRN